jgi:hypothetical protein
MNRSYIEWLKTLPCNRPQPKNWVGIAYEYEYEIMPFEEWQQRALQTDARHGVFARLLQWLK